MLTFKETVTYVLPALEIFLGEPEYLKVELFRQMPGVFNKLVKSPARISTQDSIDLLTVDIFPLISQIFMTSDSEVQEEGVDFLKKISHPVTGCIDEANSSFLFFTIV